MGSDQLPHLNLEEPPSQRSKKSMFLIAVFSFLLLSLPVSVYLVQQQQQLSSQAAQEAKVVLEKSISLSSSEKTVGLNQQIPVDVVIRSDSEYVNLASVKIQFNPSVVRVAELITNTTQSNNKVFFGKYWLSKGYDNEKGEISLIAGTPKPGIKTNPDSQPHLLAQIRFVTLGEGDATISIVPESALLSNDQNTPVDAQKNNLILTINRDASLTHSEASFSGQLLSRYAELQPRSEAKEQLVIASPKAAEVFFYFRPLDIIWTAAVERIKSITLFLNGEPYGIIAENIPNNNHYTWIPSISIPLPMVVGSNTYSLQVTGLTKEGRETQSLESPPFGLISNPEGKVISASSAAQFKDMSSLTATDASKILSRWGEQVEGSEVLDINGDLMINYLDWYLLRRGLFVKDQVY